MKPVLEKAMIEWANREGYVVGDRSYLPDKYEELRAERQFGGEAGDFYKIAARAHGCDDVLTELDRFPDIGRDVFTPTGIVRYNCFAGLPLPCDTGIVPLREDIDREIERLLKQREPIPSFCSVYHGNRVPDWKSERIPLIDRINNGQVLLQFGNDDEEMSEVTVTLMRNGFSDKRDPLSRFMSSMYFMDNQTTPDPVLNIDFDRNPNLPIGKDFLANLKSATGSVELNERTYGHIFDRISQFINSTE